jgi:hypothetical protein
VHDFVTAGFDLAHKKRIARITSARADKNAEKRPLN